VQQLQQAAAIARPELPVHDVVLASEQVHHVDHRMDYIGPHLRVHRQQDREQDRPGLLYRHHPRHCRGNRRGILFTAVGISGITGLNLYSMVVAVIGAIIVLVVYHAVRGRRAY